MSTKNKIKNSVSSSSYFLGIDGFVNYANATIEKLTENAKLNWYKLIELSNKKNGAKPTKKFLKQSKEIINEIGYEKFKSIVVRDWIEFVIILEPTEIRSMNFYNTKQLLSSKNINAFKAFVWMCSNFHDKITLQNLAALAEKCYKKIPGKSSMASSLGNACVYALYKSRGLEGISYLSNLKIKVKQKSCKNTINKYLLDSAKAKGISIHEIEDIALPQFKLENASKKVFFEEYIANIFIERIGKTSVQWIRPDGKIQKSIPAFIKNNYADKLKKTKAEIKKITQSLSAQKERIDLMFRLNRTLEYEHFHSYFFEHGLMSFLSKKLIWNIHQNNNKIAAFYFENNWFDSNKNVIKVNSNAQFSLWHPALEAVLEIKKWRDLLMDLEVKQPIKQAFREVYILTEAEVNTTTYSNRMAAHILKQFQFNALAKNRNWEYKLMGTWDGGYESYAELLIKEHNLKAEYWVAGIDVADDYSDSGIWRYISTDQVRFIDIESNEVAELIDVPPIVFSEVMRDVDLFVGVASVGNDPNWEDSGGQPFFRDYWQSYSFGNLSETAKIRKEILTGLLPRLKIKNVATLKDKFLIVKGKLRTYKIHIGSTNILMEPNDEYLCIVSDRGGKTKNQKVFLPFEGDEGLSIIISKAFMLAEDDKITDTSITSQILRV